MISKPILAIVCTSIIASGLACIASANDTPTETQTVETQVLPPTPTESFVATPQRSESLDDFAIRVQNALVSENPELISPLMGNAFSMNYVDSSGGFIAIEDAMRLLQNDLLGGTTSITFDKSVDAGTILGNIPTPTDLRIVRILFSRGWGVASVDQALVLIAEAADRSFYLGGVIYARGGFAGAPGLPTPTLELYCARALTTVFRSLKERSL